MEPQPPPGIQVRLAVDAAEACPVAAATAGEATGGAASARSVSWSRAGDGNRVVEEFDLVGGRGSDEPPAGTAAADSPADAPPEGLPADASVVFETDDTRRVRFERNGTDCACDAVERHGAPVIDVNATGGTLHLTFHAADVETVREVVTDLREGFGSVRIDRLARTDEEPADRVAVDRGQLTDRQREVLETAMEMGYFQRPREANATEVATALDISPSTFAEHLASAQSKVLGSLLEGSA
mgnify:FL=1